MYLARTAELLARYSYTSEAVCASFSSSHLYVGTVGGLETWTIRNQVSGAHIGNFRSLH